MATEFKSKIKDKSLQTREVENLTTDTSHTSAPFPKNCLIELSNACNHKCIFCTNPRMSRAIGRLDFETYKKFIIQSVPLGLREVGLYATGEPFITKNLEKYIKFAKDSGIEYVSRIVHFAVFGAGMFSTSVRYSTLFRQPYVSNLLPCK